MRADRSCEAKPLIPNAIRAYMVTYARILRPTQANLVLLTR